MPNTLPITDPIRNQRRKKIAARQVANSQQCECGENRPKALIPKSQPLSCARCQRLKEGKSTEDQHHVAGQANDPLTVPVDVNDHRAELSVDQENWEQPILSNPDGCPIIAVAARIRGFADYVIHLLKKLLRWIPAMLVGLSEYLKAQLGPEWWIGTPMEKYAPKS